MSTSVKKQEKSTVQDPAKLPVWLLAAAAVVGLLVIVVTPHILDDWEFAGIALTEEQVLGIPLTGVNLALVMAVAAMALNLLVGRTGLFSVGHAALFATGAATAAVVSVLWEMPPLAGIVAAGVSGLIIGIAVGLPSLRLRGLYLMLATLALHYIGLYAFTKFQLAKFGPSGIPFPELSLFGWSLGSDVSVYYFLVLLVALTVWVMRNLSKSHLGRAFIAVRDDEVASSGLGINVPRVRLTSFALSSSITAMAGALYAFVVGFATDVSFTLNFVIAFFAMIIVGGIGSMLGAIVGALVWTLLPYTFDMIAGHVDPATPVLGGAVSNYQSETVSILMGLTIILVLRFQPQGLAGIGISLRDKGAAWLRRTK